MLNKILKAKKIIGLSIIVILTTVLGITFLATHSAVYADHQYCSNGTEVPHSSGPPGYSSDFCASRGGVAVPASNVGDLGSAEDLGLPRVAADQSALQNVLSAVFMLVGSLSVIFVIVGGIKYVFSAGNPEATQKAKNTVLYALVGMVISVFAYALVKFVFDSL